MVIEAEAIPYEPARLRGERLLVLAPHPDDEVIGCGGLVAQHLRERRRVRVVVATDGAEQNASAADREDESRRGLALLGDAELEFLRVRDRALDDGIARRLREELVAFRPDLILVPSPIEIHPDHLALSRAFCELVQRDASLFAELAVAKVAFYEVGQPLRPNALVDISDVAEMKYAAIGEHRSQLAARDYVAYTRGLNAYRSMTIEATYAEAYFVIDLPELRTIAFSEVRKRVGTPPELEVTRATLPISVVIRTKDRPALLAEAIASVRANAYPCEIVVVNDGGAKPNVDGIQLVHHETSRGRSEAANAGVRAATNAYVAFLDDDDLYDREHLSTLANAASAATSHAAWYSDAVSVYLRPGEAPHKRLRQYEQDFDRELLLVDNYIPLPTLLIPREAFLDAGGFDPAFDLFEDWDFLIRLAQRGDFLRVPRVTVEVRHFEGGSSIILAAREGSPRFREAKLQVWRKHAALLTNDVFANVFERQKQRAVTLYGELLETKGLVDQGRVDASRLERDKQDLIEQLQEFHHSVNAHLLRIRELEGAVEALSGLVANAQTIARENDELRAANRETHAALQSARVEVDRLNGLLRMIYGSRTWKLHTLAERLKGRR